MKYKRQIIFGICYALFAWILFIIADIVDEFILDSRQVPMVKINAIVTPFVMLICLRSVSLYACRFFAHSAANASTPHPVSTSPPV